MSVGRNNIKAVFLLLAGICALALTFSISLTGGMSADPGQWGASREAENSSDQLLPGGKKSSSVVVPEESPLLDPRDDYDVQHYGLDLWLDLDANVIGGGVTLESVVTAAGIDSVILDLFDNMTVDSVKLGGTSLGFIHQNDAIRAALDRTYVQGETVSPVVYYHGTPSYTGWAVFRFNSHGLPTVPLVYSISWPDNSRGWWPCKDVLYDKATAEIRMTVPTAEHDMVVASIGLLTGVVNNPDSTRTYTWAETYPVTTYNISFSTTNFDILQETYVGIEGDSLPIRHFVFPEDRSRAEESFSNLQGMIAAYEERFGTYPFMDEKYGMAEIFLNGAMEHQTMVSYGKSLITGTHAYDMIIAHELAHMWFGNMITIGTWPDIWMSEGFATYAEALYQESLTGLQGYLDYMRGLDTGGFSGPIYDPNNMLSDTVYNKGAWILHMLRYVMGDSLWSETLTTFASDTTFMYKTAVTTDFIATCESVYGSDLDWYFNPWLYESGRPSYYFEWNATEIDTSNFSVELRLDQTQPTGTLFTMPIPFLFETAVGETTITLRDSLKTQVFQFTLHDEPTGRLLLDPNGWILKMVQSPLEITTDSLDHGTVGEQYTFVLRGGGGQYPLTWSVVSGALPDSLDMDPSLGLISGVPMQEGDYDFTVELRDSFDPPHADTSSFTLVIDPATGIEGEIRGGIGLPRAYGLYQNYPNPFNPSTVIPFDVPEDEGGPLSLTIYDLRGRRIRTLISGDVEPGRREVHWDGRDEKGCHVPSGLYLYRLDSAGFESTRRMLLVR